MVESFADDGKPLENWLRDANVRHELQCKNIKFLAEAKRLDEAGFRALDSTLKKVTSFMKKLKNIGTSIAPASLLPELEKLNVSKFLDEIAVNICEAKIKISDIQSLVEFCVKVASLYSAFSEILLVELRKHLPCKKSVTILNLSKLRVDLRLLIELILHGVLEKEGLQLLGSTLSYIINTDKTEHVNASILMPFCRVLYFDVTGIAPFSQKRLADQNGVAIPKELSSQVFTDDQKKVVVNLFKGYFDSLVEHLNTVCLEMNRLQKSIKRQERTRGDASAEDRKKFDQIKSNFNRLMQSASDLAESLGYKIPLMAEEPSDDELEDLAAKKLDTALADGKHIVWPDLDTQYFYEKLIDIRQLCRTVSVEFKDETEGNGNDDDFTYSKQEIVESVNHVDLDNLEDIQSVTEHSQNEDVEDEEEILDEEVPSEHGAEIMEDFSKMTETDLLNRGTSATVKEFFAKLTVCINRNLIDKAAVEFVTHFNKKSYRKRLIQHLLSPPLDRFDLLPFYACFIATIKPILPDITMQVAHELLRVFREFANRSVDATKRIGKKGFGRVDRQIHVSNYISELVKFSVLPKAEALACFRTLLVDFKQYKVDMLCAMIESMGLFLYRSPESHAKMSVIMQVLRDKSLKVKDPRQQILLDNAYFSVIPPEEQTTAFDRLPPIYEFLQMKIISSENRLSFFRKINWEDDEVSEFVLKMFSNPCGVRFDDLDRLASLVSGLCDYQEWVGTRVVDDVLEFIRLFLEANHPSLQQRGFSSVVYIAQLFNYNVLYQLITFGLHKVELVDDLINCVQRIRLAYELVNVVCEFFGKSSAKIKMDCFLIFLLRFYYEVREKWIELKEELGDFPQEVDYAIKELLATWRKKETFPTNLADAREAVVNLEKQYKTKVEEIMQGLRDLHDDEDRDERRLNCILEGDEEEEEFDEEDEEMSSEEEDEVVGREEFTQHSDNGSNKHDNPDSQDDDNLDEEKICVRTERKVLPEDEEFMRDLDRMISETMQATSILLKGPMTDLEVPPLARQKFERRITFGPDVATKMESSSKKDEKLSILVDNNVEETVFNDDLKMALMTRGKGNRTVLKAVRIESSETMHESWRRYQEARERERREMKQLTLAMNERIQHQYQQDEANAALSFGATSRSGGFQLPGNAAGVNLTDGGNQENI